MSRFGSNLVRGLGNGAADVLGIDAGNRTGAPEHLAVAEELQRPPFHGSVKRGKRLDRDLRSDSGRLALAYDDGKLGASALTAFRQRHCALNRADSFSQEPSSAARTAAVPAPRVRAA